MVASCSSLFSVDQVLVLSRKNISFGKLHARSVRRGPFPPPRPVRQLPTDWSPPMKGVRGVMMKESARC